MELSAEEYARIIRQIGGSDPARRDRENRRAPRIARQARVTVIPVNDNGQDAPFIVQLCNLSSRGFGLCHHHPMRQGTQFLARLGRSSGQPVEILCCVAYCHAISKDAFSIGAEFVCLAPPHQQSRPDNADQAARIRQSILG